MTPTVAACGDGADYVVTQGTTGGTYAPGVTMVPNSQCYACVVTVNLPFIYEFYGQPYDKVYVGSHGTLDFVANGNPDANTCLPNRTAFVDGILPHWDDIHTLFSSCNECGIFISMTGTAPNREFNIEWRAVLLSNNGPTVFEVRLYEGQHRFDILYNQVSGSGQNATVGVQRNGGVQYTQFSCNTASLNAGLRLIFEQPSCPTGTPTSTPTITPTLCAGCPTWTSTSTPTLTATPTCTGLDYQVTASAGATIVPGTTDIQLQCNACGGLIQLPFTYYLYGQPFDSAFAMAHGTLQFSNTFNNSSTNACLPYPFFSNTIAGYWDQMDLMQLSEGIFTSISGSAPNRIFNIEWRGCLAYPDPRSQCNGYINFEIRLYEGQDRFDIVYGSVFNGGSSATVGVQMDNGTRFTEYECSTGGLSDGMQLTFIASPCVWQTPTPTRTPTQTFTPTRTATYTRTATPTSTAVLVGHVTWQGRPAQPNTLNQLPITLTLRSGTNVFELGPFTTDSSGFFTVELGTVPQGSYGWRAKGGKFLATAGTVDLDTSRNYAVEMGLQLAGDANNDNRVTSVDFSIVRAAFGSGQGNPQYDDRADFTGDRVVNSADFNLMRNNFGTGGAPPLARYGPGEPVEAYLYSGQGAR